MTKAEFCQQVDELVMTRFDALDGGDLCWNLIDLGVVEISAGVAMAARIVARHIFQA